MNHFKQSDIVSGGSHTPPETRYLLYSLAVSIRAKDILETGYDAGHTTEALCKTGANVVGVDDLSEYPETNALATQRLAKYENCELLNIDALRFLRCAPGESYDFIFIDDNHSSSHVHEEAKEVKRILRPGGIAVFHDTKYHKIWWIIMDVFPDWDKIEFPAISPIKNEDFGIGIVVKG